MKSFIGRFKAEAGDCPAPLFEPAIVPESSPPLLLTLINQIESEYECSILVTENPPIKETLYFLSHLVSYGRFA
jgi:hypothetical protein